MLKKIIAVISIAVTLFGTVVPAQPVAAAGKPRTNWEITKDLIRKQYPGMKIKVVNGNGIEDRCWNTILSRKGKRYVVVEKVISYGDGSRHGWYTTKDGNKYIIGYNRPVRKGKRITSYIIWNPDSNECDVIDYVVDNRKVR